MELDKELAQCRQIYPGLASMEDLLVDLWGAGSAFKCQHAKGDLPGVLETDVVIFVEAICNVLAEHNPPNAARIKELCAIVAENLSLSSTADGLTPVSLMEVYHRLCSAVQEKDLLSLIITLTASACFVPETEVEALPHNQSFSGKAICPACGQEPHYAEYISETGKKIMECPICATRWQFPRITCVACGNSDSEALGYFTLEGLGPCRVHYCSVCHGYHKVFDLREFSCERPKLYLHHLSSLLCDTMAHREGFLPSSGFWWADSSAINTSDDREGRA